MIRMLTTRELMDQWADCECPRMSAEKWTILRNNPSVDPCRAAAAMRWLERNPGGDR